MSNCPYKNFRSNIENFLNLIRQPRKEFSGFAPCPFVGAEIDRDKLMIDLFDPSKTNILEMVKKLEDSKYDSALFAQICDDLESHETFQYQSYINKLLKTNGYEHLKCICFNPKDTVNIDGFNIRKKSPYFLINIANKKMLDKAHKNILKTKYFNNMNEEYLDFLQVKKEKK
tara:strand:+ start:3031 stop:3546 length:516 start_codon:yes stop_codon:yes gene_type:complete